MSDVLFVLIFLVFVGGVMAIGYLWTRWALDYLARAVAREIGKLIHGDPKNDPRRSK